jgi:hypothetical protein
LSSGDVLYQQSLRTIPAVNPNFWSFAITGAVSRPLILSYADLQTFATRRVRVAVVCAGTSADRPLMGEALWRGVPVSSLLDELTINPAARYARVHAADGYSAVLPLKRLANALLVFEMDGAPLPPEHGWPARLIAPGLHGYKMPKWIERVELTAAPDGGFWEARGWPLDGVAGLRAAILDYAPKLADPAVIALSGVFHSADPTATAIQMSVDGGGWMPISFTPGEPFTLTRWQIDWTPPGAGDYCVRVRAQHGNESDENSLVVRVR